jgi:hypothetical protein
MKNRTINLKRLLAVAPNIYPDAAETHCEGSNPWLLSCLPQVDRSNSLILGFRLLEDHSKKKPTNTGGKKVCHAKIVCYFFDLV